MKRHKQRSFFIESTQMNWLYVYVSNVLLSFRNGPNLLIEVHPAFDSTHRSGYSVGQHRFSIKHTQSSVTREHLKQIGKKWTFRRQQIAAFKHLQMSTDQQ